MIKFYLSYSKWLTVLLMCGALSGFAQQKTVSGKVTASDDGSAMPGVNILEKGTANGTVTDANGEFKIEAGANSTLTFSFVGYATQEVAVGSQTTLAVTLVTDAKSLTEVVVIGYGEVQKKDATGAVTAISNKDFNKGIMTSPQDLILGKMAGVSVTSNSGAPGDNSTIRIRGGASLSATNDPLIVIDGFPVDNFPATGVGSSPGVANPLASINPNDIETFTVLKDASATAIYGSRASNGVVIITTKKGAAGKPKFSYNGNFSIATPIKYVDVLNADQYKAMVNTMAQTGVSGINAAAVANLGTSNTNWQKEIFRNTFSNDHNLNVSGSVKNLPYRISYGYTDQQGILKTTGVQRNSLNINLNPTLLHGDLKLNISAKGNYTNTNFGEPTAVGNAVAFDPTQSPYSPGDTQYGGYFSWLSKTDLTGSQVLKGTANPVAQLNQTDNRSSSNRIITNLTAEYKIKYVPGLKLNVNVGLDRSTSDGHNKVPITAEFIQNNGTPIGKNDTYSGRNQSELTDIYLNYAKQIDLHKFDITGGYGWQHFYRDGVNTQANATTVIQSIPFKAENFLVSFFGRLNYTYNGKYLLTATLRDDGSSRFSPKNRWGLFPSVALAWQMKDEQFLSNVSFLSDLKLRVGYGVTGQQDIPNSYYPYIPTYQASDVLTQYQLGNTFYTTQRPNAYDANIRWESTATTNIGVDFGFFNNKLTGSVEVFQKDTKDLLNNVAIPNGANFSNYLTTNVGTMQNQGIEITLKAIPISTKDFTWNAGMNFTSINSKITKMNLTDDPSYAGNYHGNVGVGANIQNDQVGFPASAFFVFQQVYDASGKPIEGLYVDRSGKGAPVVGQETNKYHYKRPYADFLIGINSRFTYKKFDFSFSGRLSIGNYNFNNIQAGWAYYNRVYSLGYFTNVPTSINDTKFTSQQTYSDYYVQNASFFKMDNLSLGYSFDEIMNSKLKARFSFTVQNAFTITNYKGIDPEQNGGANPGIDNNIYPRPRTFLLGLNVTF